jgi:nucleotide-binding universal stress UspA family protein
VFESPVDQDSGVDQFDAPEFSQQRVEKVRQRLEALMTDEARTWARLQTDVSYGKPYHRILAAAEKADADLIVMGVHGRNPIDMLIMGSTTNHVVRMARSAVLTLRQ